MNSTASQSSSSGCVGGSPILPKFSSVATMPRPKCFCQRRLTMTRAVSGFCGERDPPRQREAAARGVAVGPRNLGRRIAVGRSRCMKPGCICEPRLSTSPRIRKYDGGDFVASRTLVEVAARERRRNPALRAADDVVALAERREAVVAVGGDLGHRQRRGPLLLERRRSAPSELLLARAARPASAALSISAARDVDRFEDLGREQLLARRPLASGLAAAW